MGEAVGNVLPLAVAVAVFPVPVIAAVLVLASERGTSKGLAFVGAWCAGLAAVGAVALILGGVADGSEAGGPANWINVILLVLGLLLVVLAVKQWRGRPGAREEPEVPGWMRTIGELTPARAAGVGFALTALNPKNVLLTAAAAAEIAEAGLSPGRQGAVLFGFVLVASVGVLSPLVVTLALRERSRPPLERLRRWLAQNNAVIMAVLLLLIGAKLIGDAISGFSA